MVAVAGKPGEVARRLTINVEADLETTMSKALSSPNELQYDPAKDYSQRRHPYRPEEHGQPSKPVKGGKTEARAGSRRGADADEDAYDVSDDYEEPSRPRSTRPAAAAKFQSGDDLGDDFGIELEEEDLDQDPGLQKKSKKPKEKKKSKLREEMLTYDEEQARSAKKIKVVKF